MDNLLFKNAYLSYSRVDKQNIRVNALSVLYQHQPFIIGRRG